MAKSKTQFVCKNCGQITPKWVGKCPGCEKWNTLEEESVQPVAPGAGNRFAMTKLSGEIFDLSEVDTVEYPRIDTRIEELNNVLGGDGVVPGSVILIGGEPGIGKSTLLIQFCEKVNAQNHETLYISGEESLQQVALRATRLKLNVKGVKIYSETELEKILSKLETTKPKFVIIDSIQTVFTNMLSAAPGSVSQIKDCAARLTRYAKESNTTMILVGHVTKDGDLAGPRVLEHIVDTVLYFEGEKDSPIRMLRATKNRFGSVNEVGVFAMSSLGLEQVRDLGTTFMSNQSAVTGSSSFMTLEGSRPILVEVQALLDSTQANIPIKSAVGFDQKRLSQLMAVLNKYLSVSTYQYNVFVGLIGGFKTQDTCADLPILLAMLSSYKNKSLPDGLVAFAEVGLTGELRVNYNFEARIKEASRLGAKSVMMPYIDAKKKKELESKYPLTIYSCKDLKEVIRHLQSIM